MNIHPENWHSQHILLINMDEYSIGYGVYTDSLSRIKGALYGYSLSDSKEVLTLFYTIYDSTSDRSVKSIHDAEYQTAVNRLQGFYNVAIRGLKIDLEEEGKVDSPLYLAARDIYDNQATITSVRLLILSNCTINNYDIKSQRINGKITIADVWDLKKIFDNLHSGLDHAPIDIDFTNEYKRFKIPFIEMESSDFGYKCIVALFPGKLLYQLYERHNTDLLLNNVRFFLGFKGSKKNNANIGILKTLKEESQMFLAYNNGITALASDIESQSLGTRTDVGEEISGKEYISMGLLDAIRDFRIVNGGQTTASIFNSKYRDSNISLTGVFIQVKIIVLSRDVHEIASKITRYSNSQSKIKYADFSVSNAFNVTLEKLSRNIIIPNKNNDARYWYFERVRGQYDQEKRINTTKESLAYFTLRYPKQLKFKKEEVAKVWKSWDQEPYEAVKGEGTNYELFMSKIDGYIPDETYYKNTIALMIIYRFLLSRPENKNYGNRKATIITYALAYLNYITFGRLDLNKIWENQKPAEGMIQYLNQLCESINDAIINLAGEMSVLSWGKRKDSFKQLTKYGIAVDRNLLNDIML